MATRTVDVHELQEQLEELLALVQAGGEVIVMDGMKTIARVVPVSHRNGGRIAGLHLGAMQASDDFDEPLPDELWTGTT
jgi:antitoxin (DNA-binding transcriptional repressor) of toxin-antitoxin stability system